MKITHNVSISALRGAKRRGIKALIQVPKTFMDELHAFINGVHP